MGFFAAAAMAAGCIKSGASGTETSEISMEKVKKNMQDGLAEDGEYRYFCEASSREEAEKIADMYGIALEDFDRQIAVFVTEKEPDEIIKTGENKGYPVLYPDREMKAFGE